MKGCHLSLLACPCVSNPRLAITYTHLGTSAHDESASKWHLHHTTTHDNPSSVITITTYLTLLSDIEWSDSIMASLLMRV